MEIFTERLRDLREDHDYTQKQIAEVLDVEASSYGYYERGVNEPSLATLHRIAKFYDVSLDYLLGIIDTPKHPVEVSKGLQLMEAELEVVKKLKATVLPDVGKQPKAHTERLIRCWRFLQQELKHD